MPRITRHELEEFHRVREELQKAREAKKAPTATADPAPSPYPHDTRANNRRNNAAESR